MKPLPPQIALRLLRWFCHEDYLEEIEGNLLELYQQQYAASPKKARRQFFWNVLRHVRPAFIRSFKLFQPTNHRAMLRHNLLLTFRSFQRYKSTFLINTLGLSSGLACALLIFMWVQDELSIDSFHANDDHLYQIMLNAETPSGIRTLEWTPGPLAQLLVEELPEVKQATSVYPPGSYSTTSVLTLGDTRIKANSKYAGRNYFTIFSYDFIEGNSREALEGMNNVVISESLAKKLFNTTTGVVGNTIEGEQGELSGSYLISGVFQDIPSNGSIQFDAVFNYELLRRSRPELSRWSYNDPSTYVVLEEGTHLATFSDKIVDLIKRKDLESRNTLFPRKYSGQYLYGNFENGKISGGRITYVRLFTAIAMVILVIACINFMNLSTARASRRFKELGVKKAIGASRSALALQYIGESTLIAFFSLFIALLLILVFLPQFNQITGKQLSLVPNFAFIGWLIGVTLFTGLVAGSYPALYLSGFNPVKVLKGRVLTSASSTLVRKGLVVFQFAVSVILIVSVWIIYQQIDHVQNRNLGYDKDNVVTFAMESLEEKSLRTFLREIESIPGSIRAATMRGNLTAGDHNNTTGLTWDEMNDGDEIDFTDIKVGYNFFETLGINVNEGRTYSEDFSAEDSKLILNQTAIDRMGISDPVGKTVTLWGQDRQIIGVVSDFHFESLYTEVKPSFFRLAPNANNVLVKIQAGTEQETLTQLQSLYRAQTGTSLEYLFLDQEYQALYAAEQRASMLSRYFAGIAIFISCLGLFGLAAFTAERKLKEIGVRKALGASSVSIVRLLSGEFTKMVLVAIMIALPISYFAAQQWLQNFAFHIDLQWWYFAGAALSALLIALITVGSQTWKAARVNPVECLRDE